ncbi:MAG: amidohydrolase family protein [Rhodospirillaceae bacterium]|nr:amidohydrolase family protein [Rhodospirillaceae bacterium]
MFQDVNLVTLDAEELIPRQTVLIAEGRIAAMGPEGSITVPPDAVAIDATGRYLMPGLTEMHGHVPGLEDPQFLEDVLFLYVANGVTAVRGMQGREGHIRLRGRIDRNEVLGPRFITSGPALSGNSVDGPDEARQLVLDQAAAGYDFIKVLRGLTREEFDAAVQAAAEAGTYLAGHVPEEVGVARALEAGQATIDHIDGYPQYMVSPEFDPSSTDAGFYGVNLLEMIDDEQIAQVARETRDAGVWIVPTNTMIANVALSDPSADELASRPQMAYLPPDLVQGWVQSKQGRVGTINREPGDGRRLVELRNRIVRIMHEEGVGLLLGSDAPQFFNVPGFSLHNELAYMVDAGLSPYEALHMGTVAPADFFDAEDEFGRIAVGLSADLVLLADNPLEDVGAASRPLGVMVRGRWLDRDALDAGLTAIADRRR